MIITAQQIAEFRNILAHSDGLPGDDARRVAVELAEENGRLRAALTRLNKASKNGMSREGK